ncbi:MAG: hypothetical protein HOG08_02395 [Candidatus Magasanikbacteria bacterium]|nr:hypothetical protein [Candidatus Magasanikbacteria bacterium]
MKKAFIISAAIILLGAGCSTDEIIGLTSAPLINAEQMCLEMSGTPTRVSDPFDDTPTIDCTFPDHAVCDGRAILNKTCTVRPQVIIPEDAVEEIEIEEVPETTNPRVLLPDPEGSTKDNTWITHKPTSTQKQHATTTKIPPTPAPLTITKENCDSINGPVCTTNLLQYTSPCVAIFAGHSIKHEGVCTTADKEEAKAKNECFDVDGDGYYGQEWCDSALDCDDRYNNTHPGHNEICLDGLDNDCDGAIDEKDDCTTRTMCIGEACK